MLKREPVWHSVDTNDAQVVCPRHQQDEGLLALVENSRLVVDSIAQVSPNSGDILLLETRPDVLISTFSEALELGLPSENVRVTLLLPLASLDVLCALALHDVSRHLTLTGLNLSEDTLTAEFRPARESDLAADDLIRTLQLGYVAGRAAGPTPIAHADAGASEDLTEKLADTLELLGEYVTAAPPDPAEEMTTPPAAGVPDAAEIAALQGKVTTLTVKLATLQRKYDALATSRLGRITLANWERKKAH